MSTITIEQQNKISKLLDKMPLVTKGVGNEESACSIATINLALIGKLTDTIPECMSIIIGKWVIRIQDAMPTEMRNSSRWRSLIPKAAGTGCVLEQERSGIILDWMWEIVLPQLQLIADEHGFGVQWRLMTETRTVEASRAAHTAVRNARTSTYATCVAARAAVDYFVTTHAVVAATDAAIAASAICDADYWTKIDPCSLLEKLIEAK